MKVKKFESLNDNELKEKCKILFHNLWIDKLKFSTINIGGMYINEY